MDVSYITREEFDRQRAQTEADHRSFASGLASLSELVGRNDEVLRSIRRAVDGDGTGRSLLERLTAGEATSNSAASATKEFEGRLRVLEEMNIRREQRVGLLEQERADKRKMLMMIWSALVTAGVGLAIEIGTRLWALAHALH